MDWKAASISFIFVFLILLGLAVLSALIEYLDIGELMLLIMVSIILYIGISTYFWAKGINDEDDKSNHTRGNK